MTLSEIDGLIDVAIDAGALFVTATDWQIVAAAPGVIILDNGGLNYRGLDVWITRDTRVADRNEAARLPRV
ncbi:hypothetical protein RM53_15615 [Brevundimonas nasdae]|uniref:Uncharacterized protein n=1 Tax=Brevundimonas nasdae TaxID=172043 RepID=A0A0B4C274_9CAUL|nr:MULTISPECIES: hypothetical protein [Brevundimonas]KIC55129.1 hypothetical protein RM53_15615 [Brevundimonas nasdae]